MRGLNYRIAALGYILLSSFFITSVFSLVLIFELQNERIELIETVEDLTGIENENQELLEQLEEVRNQTDQLRETNEYLEEMLFNLATTYTAVTEGVPAPERYSGTQLSRSGRGTITGVNMPVLSQSCISVSAYERAFNKLGATGMVGIGDALVQAEQTFGVNSLVLASIAYLESAGGSSAIARDKNNLLGLGAYDGSAYRSAISFVSPGDSIMFAAELLTTDYLTPGGRYYNGPDLRGINIRYASDPHWAHKVAAVMERIARAAVDKPEELIAYADRAV